MFFPTRGTDVLAWRLLYVAMMKKVARLFVIKTRWEACLIIYALALGCLERGMHYHDQFPGLGGWLLLVACTGSVFLAGAKIFDSIRYEEEAQAVGTMG